MPTVGPYELEVQLGAGATGTVWRARRRGAIEQVVALKRLPGGARAADLDRLRREASALAELDHPHIVRVLELVEDDGGLAIAMQYAPGGSLEALLAARGALTAGELVAVAAPVADALASAHRRGVLHRDVKPANILFTSDGEPLLADFGVAGLLGGPVTTEHAVRGTAEYLAPELLDGSRPDTRTDVYSLGVVCYEALTGAPPYAGATPLAVIRAADRGQHALLAGRADVPAGVAVQVERAIDRDPSARFDDAGAFGAALRGSASLTEMALPTPVGAPSPTGAAGRATRTFGPRPPEPPAPGRRRRVLLTGAAVAGGVVALVLLFRLLSGGDDTGSEANGCAEPVQPAVPAGGELYRGDLDGDGCPSFAVWIPGAATNAIEAVVDPTEDEPRRYTLGEPGDLLVLGDWNCDDVDGADTPALYRPTTGQVFYFLEWAEPGQALPDAPPEDEGILDAEPRRAEGTADDGCDAIELVGGDRAGE